MVIMEISIVPLGTASASVSSYVAQSLKILENVKGINYELHPMGTIIEADSLEKLFELSAKMHNTLFSDKVKRVVTSIKIDERRDKQLSMSGKIKAVKDKL
ncbi:MAG: MTH1187 family thiamine-binding protein [Spirochaetales bacterium]|nr:MTH1187 family thiamine-binding protein [Spirochaetales bacterium]